MDYEVAALCKTKQGYSLVIRQYGLTFNPNYDKQSYSFYRFQLWWKSLDIAFVQINQIFKGSIP